MNDTGCFQRPSPNPRNISWWQAAFSDLRLPHSWRSILPWCFHGYSRSWSGLMQRLSLLVDIFFRGSDFGYNSIIQSLECYNMGRVCQTHTCRLHRGVHFIRFASHISFFQFMFSLQSFCSCSVWYTRQALTCMSWKWGASSFLKNHFQGFFRFPWIWLQIPYGYGIRIWVRSWLFHPDLLKGQILFCAAAGLGKRLPKAGRGERSLREGHSRALKCLFELDRS